MKHKIWTMEEMKADSERKAKEIEAQKEAKYGHNEKLYADKIKALNPKNLNPEWVLWMLRTIGGANQQGVKINPEWVNSTHECFFPMSVLLGQLEQQDFEPVMEFID